MTVKYRRGGTRLSISTSYTGLHQAYTANLVRNEWKTDMQIFSYFVLHSKFYDGWKIWMDIFISHKPVIKNMVTALIVNSWQLFEHALFFLFYGVSKLALLNWTSLTCVFSSLAWFSMVFAEFKPLSKKYYIKCTISYPIL
jgi:hypothetical protein